jgi:hypothetical protein
LLTGAHCAYNLRIFITCVRHSKTHIGPLERLMPSANESELQIQTKNGKIFSPIRQKWLEETPEERVRQEYLLVLVNEYGYSLDQIGEEEPVTGRGSGQARADFLIWRSTFNAPSRNASRPAAPRSPACAPMPNACAAPPAPRLRR